MTNQNGLVIKRGLDAKELGEIKVLADVCNSYEEIDLKLNWDKLQSRPLDEVNDFLYYEDGVLLGFLGIYMFNSREAEIGGMVHPDARRKGVFRQLLEQAVDELKRRGIPKLLLVVDNNAKSGLAFAEAQGSQYRFSEYRMVLTEAKQQPKRFKDLLIRKAKPEDANFIANCIEEAFKLPKGEVEPHLPDSFEQPNTWIMLIQKGQERIGVLYVQLSDQLASLYGFGILPEHQGRGYGRQVLSEVVQMLLSEGYKKLSLEVACENKRALRLYQDCGFVETAGIDYFELSVGSPS